MVWKNALVNPSFEQGLAPWFLRQWTGDPAKVSLTTVACGYGGGMCALLKSTDWNANIGVAQTLPCVEGQYIANSVYIKNPTGYPTGALQLKINFYDASGTYIGDSCFKQIDDATTALDWTLMSASGYAPAGAVSMNFYLLYWGIGELYIDNAALMTEVVVMPQKPVFTAFSTDKDYALEGEIITVNYTITEQGEGGNFILRYSWNGSTGTSALYLGSGSSLSQSLQVQMGSTDMTITLETLVNDVVIDTESKVIVYGTPPKPVNLLLLLAFAVLAGIMIFRKK